LLASGASKSWDRKEVKQMRYIKPEVTLVDHAAAVIHGIPKAGMRLDLDGGYVTAAAYEADE
jgi:hypothetical protein